MNKKFEYEHEIAKRILDDMGISYVGLADPLEIYKTETGADVQTCLSSGLKIGIQVTVFHSDEDSAKNGSKTYRSQEEKDKKLGIIQTYGVPTDYRPALRKRIGEKISRAQNYSFSEFDEVWLMVAASLPQAGAMASTTMLSLFIDADELNNDHHEALSHSKYAAAFLFIFNEGKIFQWQPLTKWQLAKDDHLKPPPLNEVNAIERWRQCLSEPEFRKDPREWAKREALKILREQCPLSPYRRQERDEEHSMDVENKFGLAAIGFVLGVVASIAGIALVSFLSWNFDMGMFEVRLVLGCGICSSIYFYFFQA